MKRIPFVLFLALVLIWCCEDRDDNLTTAKLRIYNKSNVDFTTVQLRADSLVFNDVASNSVSEYLEFEPLFEQDTLLVATDSLEYTYFPMETYLPLPIGLYTYELDISDDGAILLSFSVDN